MIFPPKIWCDALRRIQHEIPDFVFDAWIAPLAVKLCDDRLMLGCPTSFHRDRVRLHHLATIERCWRAAADAAGFEATVGLELMTPSEFAEAEGVEIETSALPQPVISDRQHARAAMRKVEVAAQARTAAAAGASNGADSDPRRPTVARAGSPGASLEPTSAATSNTSAATASAGSGATFSSSLGAGYPSVAGSGSVGESRESGDGPMLRVVPGLADRKGADPVRNDAAQPRTRARADHPNGLRQGLQNGLRPRLDYGLNGDPAVGKPQPFGFDSFIMGPCNALAREAAMALARRRQRSLNQLYLAGATGMGKTHLARATAEEARLHSLASTPPVERARAARSQPSRDAQPRGGSPRFIYMSAEQFTSEFVSAMRNGRSEAWSRRYRGPIEMLVIEDIQLLAGRTKTQLELYHTIEHVLDSGGCVLLTGDRAPRDLTDLDERMRALVARGFVAELERPDALVRRHILRAKAAAGGVSLPNDCLDLLVDSTSGSVRDLESVLIQVVTTASLLGRPIDLALTREAIDLKTGAGSALAPRKLAVEEVVRIVATFFGTRPEALASRSRRRDVLVPRQLCMYLANRYTDASLTEIGRGLGRDHPSVRNAISRIERQVLEKAPLRYQVEALIERLERQLENPER